jgi:TolB-like protein
LRALALIPLLACGVAHAAPPSLAVMPLRDLAAGRANVGAALRETLTVDLRATPGIKVVEREAIDRVIREQAIDLGKGLEGVPGARLGTLLGASHLVTGAYQRERGTLRVTVRVIAVETGQVVGSAKVDGELEKMLELEDRVSTELLRSVGWRPPAEPRPHRARPRLSGKAIERFGDAQLEPDA